MKEQSSVAMQTMIQHQIYLSVRQVFVRTLTVPMAELMVRHQLHTNGDVNTPEISVAGKVGVFGNATEMGPFVETVPVKMLCLIAGRVHRPAALMGPYRPIQTVPCVQRLKIPPKEQHAKTKDIV